MTLNKKNILLVGGAGFIGHNLAIHLKQKGAVVSITDGLSVNNLLYLHSSDNNVKYRQRYINFINERLNLLRENDIPLYVEDARDYHKLSGIINKVKPDVVVVLSAVAHANRSIKDPFSTFDHSLRTLENCLDNARNRVEHVIYFSSSMVYGHFPKEGVTEETPCNPIGIYGNLKYAGEKMVHAYHNSYDQDYTIIRPSALYGERCISRRVAQIFVEEAMTSREITISGDGSDKLDFTYINDLVHGVERVIESKNSRNQTFNLTYGESRSLAQLSEILKKEFPDIKVNYTPKDKLVPDRGTLIVDKARELIGYNPQHALEKGFPHYIDWYKNQFSRLNTAKV